VQTKIVDRINLEFQQEQIKRTISDVAGGQAAAIIEREVRPALEHVQGEAASASRVITELQQRVQEQSAAVNVVAQQAAAATQAAEGLRAKTTEVDSKVAQIDTALASARMKLEEIDRSAAFTSAVLAALSDDRRAYDQLEHWGTDPSYPLHDRALAAWQMVMDSHASVFVMEPAPVPWKEGVDPAKLTFDELRQTYEHAPAWLKPSILNYIWTREDIPKRDRLQFMADVMTNDASLKGVDEAGRLLSSALKANLKPLAIKALLDRWNDAKSSPEWQPSPATSPSS